MSSLVRFETTGAVRAALVLLLLVFFAPPAYTAGASESSDIEVMQEFTEQETKEGEAVAISEQRKHLILFIMGIALLVLLIITAALGISMVVSGKQVFVAHMVFAGLSVTLAVAHAVVAIVWFFPFK